MKQILLCCITSLTTCMSIPALAEKFILENVEQEEDSFLAPVISLRGGVDLVEVGESQNVAITIYEPAPNYFRVTNRSETKAVWGGFLGLDFSLGSSGKYHWQTGVSYYQTEKFHVEGLVEPFASSWIVDLDFDYSVKNQRILFENKFLAALNKRVSFYGLFGLGGAKNKAYDFVETPRDPLVAPDPPFADKSVNSFSYSIGLGLEALIIDDLFISLGYQFSDLGKIKLGEIDYPSATDESISNDHTYANEFLLGLTYVYN